MTTLVNLTSVGLDIVDETGRQLLYLPPPPKGQEVQLVPTHTERGTLAASNRVLTATIPVQVATLYELAGLPDPAPGVVYVVPSVVFEHALLAHRDDLACPGPSVKGADGKPVGCQGLRLRHLPSAPSPIVDIDVEARP